MDWISVDERLPKYGEVILIARRESYSEVAKMLISLGYRSYTDSGGEHWEECRFSGGSIFVPPTHWQPLPEPPEEQDNERLD